MGGFFVLYKTAHAPTQIRTAQQMTTIIHYVPTDIKGLAQQNGTCWENSIAAPYRSDAWRCMTGNSLSDPCFTIATTNAVLCNPDPSGLLSTKPYVLNLTAPLPGPDPDIPTDPQTSGWLIQLSDGTVCTPFTGTRSIMNDGTVTTYGCNNPSEGTVFGDLVDNGSGTWTATVGTSSVPKSPNDSPIILTSKQVAVKTVWQ